MCVNAMFISETLTTEKVQTSHSPPVSLSILVAGPVPALFTAATSTLYKVDGFSPETVCALAFS